MRNHFFNTPISQFIYRFCRDRNWLEFLAVLDATLHPIPSPDSVDPESKDKISRAREFFSKVEKEDGLKDRSAMLAILELEKRASTHGLVEGWQRQFHLPQIMIKHLLDSGRMLILMKQYFEKFGDKACCFEDLKPYLNPEQDNLSQFRSFLKTVPPLFVSG